MGSKGWGCILGSLVCMILYAPSIGHGYLEESFFCDVDNGKSLLISQSTGSSYCFTLLAELSEQLAEVENDIALTQRHIDAGRDPTYRGNVQRTFVKKKETLTKQQTYIQLAMKDFEHDLFIRVKSISSYYLKSWHSEVSDKLTQADVILARSMLLGDQQQYRTVRKKRDALQHTFMLLETTKQATTFSQMIPPLKELLHMDTGIDENVTLTKEHNMWTQPSSRSVGENDSNELVPTEGVALDSSPGVRTRGLKQ